MIGVPIACFFTGHRIIPKNCYDSLKSFLREEILNKINIGVKVFIAGGALGFDTLAAEQVISIREDYPDIELQLYLPCINQDEGWSEADRSRYHKIIQLADRVVYISRDAFSSNCMKKRNQAMVDSSEYGIAYLTNNQRSGSSQTVGMAKINGIEVTNLAEML